MFTRLITLYAFFALTSPAFAEYAERIAALTHKEGLIDLYVDEKEAEIYLSLNKSEGEDDLYGRYIYAPALSGGLGSNPVGLDRALSGGSDIIRFRRAGMKIYVEVENSTFRAVSDNKAERDAVERSFAHSVIWSTSIEEEAEDGRVLIDFSGFVKRDAMGIASRLKARGQGNFRLQNGLSYVRTSAALAFPINLEFDAVLTFTSADPGREVNTTTPDPRNVSLIHHTSLIKLPEAGYETRRFDERAGLIAMSYVDMAAPLEGDVVTRLARRFRLQKDAAGKVINPIVFYVDNGAPEPIQSALVEGASWWATAFEAAGFPGGYRVEVLPDGVHPLDARYNVINWVHRSTRGWSYGAALHDPRTGEALRGIVILGSLRVRQDIKIFEALMGAEHTGTGDPEKDPVQIALKRIRQLSAHEVGHTLGFGHNMAGSSYGGRASVMDYPAPDIKLKNGEVDASNAYAVGMGAWDDFTVKFLYGDYAGQSDAEAQAALMREADAEGLVFVSDFDSRNPGTGHVAGALWDNGSDPLEELSAIMELRRHALESFGDRNLRPDEPAWALQSKIVPLYLYHRYQVNAVGKLIGGSDFTYRREGDGRKLMTIVPAARQKAAVEALLATLKPEALSLSPTVLRALAPRGADYFDPQFNREIFASRSGPNFDLSAAVGAATEAVFNSMLHPRRLARLSEQVVIDDSFLALDSYLDMMTVDIIGRLRDVRQESPQEGLIRGVVEERYISRLMALMQDARTTSAVRADIRRTLLKAQSLLERRPDALGAELAAMIKDGLARAKTPAYKAPKAPAVPSGSPIGAETCWHGCS